VLHVDYNANGPGTKSTRGRESEVCITVHGVFEIVLHIDYSRVFLRYVCDEIGEERYKTRHVTSRGSLNVSQNK